MEAESSITHVDNDTVSIQQPMKETAIVYLPAQAELNGLIKDGLSTIPLIAWAVVLNKFTDMDAVSFDVHYLSSCKATEERAERQSSTCVVSIDPEARRYDVLIALSVNDEVPTARLYYRSPAISGSHAKHLRGNMAEAIKWIVKNPEQKMRNANIFSPEDHHQIAQWNNKSYFDQVDGQIIDAIIDQHALSNPTAAAINSWDGNLTYTELKSLSIRLAAHLQSLGVGPGDMVPLCMEKSLWAIVAVLAVIRSGAAFVPLEALQPTKRLEGIIDRVHGRVILASPAHAAGFERAERTVVRVSADAMAQLSPPEYITTQRTASSTAYVLFTSGSTGRPKGCIMNHSGLTGFAAHALPLQITSTSRVLQFASYSVHASLVETFCALSAGGTLCIPTDHDRMNDLRGFINRMGVTWTTMTPSTLKTLDTQNLRSMQTILLGAEAIPKNAYEIFQGGFWLLIGYEENSASPSLMAFILEQGASTAKDSSLFMTPDEQFHLRARKAESRLREQLPGHMVPTVYIPLSYVPMTVSRKLDRRAIRTQAATLSQHQLLQYRTEPKTGENEKAKPSSITEVALHRMFALLLDLEPAKIGVNDSFYALGGHSIGAMQLVSMCQAENIPLIVQDLFEKETIAGLADAVERNRLN
ncbi:acetyl-CoA synthetase-like protein [Penicillium cf. griseofulvum]|nr:acetyl-CoA synthetase-like protein [Penicillium cf. griseofulvum]